MLDNEPLHSAVIVFASEINVFLVAIDFGLVLFFARLTWKQDNFSVTPQILLGINPFNMTFAIFLSLVFKSINKCRIAVWLGLGVRIDDVFCVVESSKDVWSAFFSTRKLFGVAIVGYWCNWVVLFTFSNILVSWLMDCQRLIAFFFGIAQPSFIMAVWQYLWHGIIFVLINLVMQRRIGCRL